MRFRRKRRSRGRRSFSRGRRKSLRVTRGRRSRIGYRM